MFFTPYFNFWALIKISIKLKQAPRVFCEFKSINFFKNGRIKNRKLHISLPLSNDFEKFLVSSIFKHIPYVYLEGFSHLRKEVLKINFYADTIFTANAHIHCELFKLWCAEQIKANKSKIIISSHGGSIPSKKASFYSKHEEKISHKAVVWYKPIRVGQVRISANKFLSLKKNKAKKINDVTLIGLDAGMFAFGMGSGPKSSSMLEDFSHKVEFIKNISSDVFTHIKVFPYPNSPWNLQKRLVDIFGGGVISKLKNYNSVITNSKIIVCLYPQTTFSDAMFSETPTILLYDKRYWDFPPEFDDLLIQLEQAKIVFSDPLLAANHISNVFDNVDKWWEYKVTIEARKKFFNDCLLVDKDWASEWSLFFNQIQHSTKSLSHDSCSRKK